MRLRSLLFVPGDRPERFEKAARCGADSIILDLEDSVAASAKDMARSAIRGYLDQPCEIPRFVRVNPVGTSCFDIDLTVLRGADGVVLPKSEHGETVEALLELLPPEMLVLPITTETPAAVFGLGTYRVVSPRLVGLTWGAEDLPAAIGAISSRDDAGAYTAPYEVLRSLVLFGAHAAGTQAIETVYPAIRDQDGLAAYAARGARDGFSGMMALHPAQVPIINAAFTPSAEEVAAARRIVDAFAAEPDAGVMVLDGRMVDRPHLVQAEALLLRAGKSVPPP